MEVHLQILAASVSLSISFSRGAAELLKLISKWPIARIVSNKQEENI
jgi:hypothetical protein